MLQPTPYRPPSLLFNAHLQTIYPSLFRKINVSWHRERIGTPDNDFLDLDWLKHNSNKLVLISHGLEGNSRRAYVNGMALHFYKNGYDVLAWNYRGCSEEMNRQLRFYHSGATDDLDHVVTHCASLPYDEIYLIGFSLGGNLTLKYLGEKRNDMVRKIKKAVTFSVPLNLHASCIEISRPSNWIYSQRFLRSLKKKITEKATSYPQQLDVARLASIKTLLEFDDQFTAPLHGFRDAVDYYTRCSSIHFLKFIQLPTLIVNAWNDPFLSKECFPVNELKSHPKIILEPTAEGGHCGFASFKQNGVYWSEERALNFISND
jgi:predicted alpha/beta-fold hydrolase